MKTSPGLVLGLLFGISSALAHTWAECMHDRTDLLLEEQHRARALTGTSVDPRDTYCMGRARDQDVPGNWITNSAHYSFDAVAQAQKPGSFRVFHSKGAMADVFLCHPRQRVPGQKPNAPMATLTPGQVISTRFWGNGHANGNNVPGGDPGNVYVYFVDTCDRNLVYVSELEQARVIGSAHYAQNGIHFVDKKGAFQDQLQFLNATIPSDAAPGVHMLIFTQEVVLPDGQIAVFFTTCADVLVRTTGAHDAGETNPGAHDAAHDAGAASKAGAPDAGAHNRTSSASTAPPAPPVGRIAITPPDDPLHAPANRYGSVKVKHVTVYV